LKVQVAAPVKSIPYRVVTSLRLPGASAPGPAPTRFRAPSTTSPGLAHMRRGHPPPSRCRSQAFSASQRFASTPGLRGLVSCRSRPWGSPFRALLLARIARPSRGPPAPLRFSVAVPAVRCSRPRPPGFAALARPAPGSPRLPPELGRRFRRARARLPRRPGPRSPGPPRFLRRRPLRSLPPRASPRSRPPVARRPRADALLGFCPSRAFVRPEPRALLTRRTIPSVAELASRRREGLPLAGG